MTVTHTYDILVNPFGVVTAFIGVALFFYGKHRSKQRHEQGLQ